MAVVGAGVGGRRGDVDGELRHVERGDDGTGLEQVGVVAHLGVGRASASVSASASASGSKNEYSHAN